MFLKIKKMYQQVPSHWQEMMRFCLVGGLATIIHYVIYLLLQLWIWKWVAYTIGYAMSFVINYLLTNYFTFKTKPSIKNGGGFFVSHAVNYGLHLLLLELFLCIGVSPVWAPIPVYCIVIPVNFLLVRFIFTQVGKK